MSSLTFGVNGLPADRTLHPPHGTASEVRLALHPPSSPRTAVRFQHARDQRQRTNLRGTVPTSRHDTTPHYITRHGACYLKGGPSHACPQECPWARGGPWPWLFPLASAGDSPLPLHGGPWQGTVAGRVRSGGISCPVAAIATPGRTRFDLIRSRLEQRRALRPIVALVYTTPHCTTPTKPV